VVVLILWQAVRQQQSVSAVLGCILRGRTRLPWRTALSTLLLLLLLVGGISELALTYHVLGTDKVGEDVLYQALKSIRTGC
jgi:peptide/nickel transport system permease protein